MSIAQLVGDMPSGMEDALAKYGRTGCPQLRERLIIYYAGLVRLVVGRLGVYTGVIVEYEDLISFGIIGLIDAIERFDFSKGVKFETYATLRIRGSVIDNIRRADWIPRSIRRRGKELERVYAKLEQELGREPNEEEIAAALGLNTEEVRDVIQKAQLMNLVSLDEYIEVGDEASAEGGISKDDPQSIHSRREIRELLSANIKQLTQQQQLVISLYYFDGLTLKEVSSIMSVTESRVSQIHNKALLRLSNRLGRYKSVLFDI